MADARATLLEALDQIDRVSAEHEGEVVRVFVVVTYSVETTTAIEAAQADDDD